MKINTILLICFLFLTQSIVYSAVDVSNSKQIKKEQKYQEIFKNKLENDKSLIYASMIMEDYFATKEKSENGTIWNTLLNLNKKYKNDTNNVNYIYSKKAMELYSAIIQNAVNIRMSKDSMKLKPIVISNDIFDKLDKNVLSSILILNITVYNMQR